MYVITYRCANCLILRDRETVEGNPTMIKCLECGKDMYVYYARQK